MPVKIEKLGGGRYRVSTPNGVKAHRTTLRNAIAQKLILERAERHEALERKRR